MITQYNGQDVMKVVIPGLPPTSNHIYVTNWRKKMRFMSKEAAGFQKKMLADLTGPYLPYITSFVDDASLYWVWYIFYFEPDDILNKTFGMKGGTLERYKQLDIDNRVKLVQDTFAKGIGVNDKQFWRIILDKVSCAGVGSPQIHITLGRINPSDYGV